MKTLLKGILIPSFLSLIASFSSIPCSLAQSGLEVEHMIPPSPEAAALGKYGAVPVNEYTGIHKISIPLHTVSYKDISVPLSLSYHAGGFRVSEDASRAGLGWTVQAGGLISRNVRGYKDEVLANPGYSNLAANGYVEIDCGDANLVEEAAAENGVDAQPDMFSINFLGYSGRFVFTPEGDVKMLDCTSFLELTPTISGSDIISWLVKDGSGFTYKFEEYERSKNHAVTYSGTGAPGTGTYSDWANTSWYLTEIISPLHDKVTLEYEEITPVSLQRNVAITESSNHLYSSDPSSADCSDSYSKTIIANHMFRWVKLVSITTPLSVVYFEDGIARQDLTGTRALGRILVTDAKSGNSISAVDFTHTHFQAPGCSTPDECFRLKLNKVSMVGFDDLQQPQTGGEYVFTYNNIQLPAKTSFEQDHWGYYNANGQDVAQSPTLLPAMTINGDALSGADREPNASVMMACMLNEIKYPTGGSTIFTFEPNTYSFSGGQSFPPKVGGGVRIKSMKNVSLYNQPDMITEFYYTDKNNSSYSSGKINSPLDYTYDRTVFTETQDSQGNIESFECYYTVRESNSHIPVMTTGGSIVGYDKIEKRTISANNPNGKTVSYFFSPMDFPDEYQEIDPEHNQKLILVRNNEWKRGRMEKQEVYDETGFMIQKTDYDYSFPVCNSVYGLSSSIFRKRLLTGPGIQNEFFCYTFEEQIGWVRLNKVTSTTFTPGNANSFVSTETNYTYNAKGQPRSTFSTNSDGSLHTEESYYVGETDPSNSSVILGIPEMWDNTNPDYKHILTPVAMSRSFTDGILQGESKAEFSYDASADVVLLDQNLVYPTPGISNPFKTEYFYDDKGMITGSRKLGGATVSILRSRNKALISAKVVNAKYEDAAYTSFDIGVEKDPANNDRRIEGRWEFLTPNNAGGGWSSANAKTGIGQYDFNSQRQLQTTVSTAGKYRLSFWAKNNNPINTSVPSTLVLTETANDGWKLYIYELTLNAGQFLTLTSNYSGSSYIDELRLHPVHAQMITVCYDLNLRVRTETDINMRTANYGYDAFGRVTEVRDHNGSLLKEHEYHFAN